MCGIVGIINTDRIKLMEVISVRQFVYRMSGAMVLWRAAAYGIYPGHKDNYAVHIMYQGGKHSEIIKTVEAFLELRTKLTIRMRFQFFLQVLSRQVRTLNVIL